VQSTMSTPKTPSFEVRPVTATIFGILALAIVMAAASDSTMPILGGARGQLIGLWLVGSIMCGMGIAAMKERYGFRGWLAGAPFGIVATALILSALFGWSLLLQPIADAMRGSGSAVSLDRAAIVGVGAIMAVKWLIAFASMLPRRA